MTVFIFSTWTRKSVTKCLSSFSLMAMICGLSLMAVGQKAIDENPNSPIGSPETSMLAAPSISQISQVTLPQAGRLKITGNNFDSVQGTGFVSINGANAPVSSWSDTSITAYVSDNSSLGAGTVEVVASGGTSNSVPFSVTPRPSANGRVQWRFQVDDLYIIGRPAIGTDGTIYAASVSGHIFALTPDGGIKWIFSGNFPVMQSVSVGTDNTAYFAGGNVVYAVNPNGTLKWKVINPSGGSIAAGPNVGPDGNIYAVGDLGDPAQLGAMTISPAGQVLNNRPGYLQPRGRPLINREIVFSSNQFYFGGLNNVTFNTSGLEVLQLGGNYRFTIPAGGEQPAIAPCTIYSIIGANTGNPERIGAYSPANGSLLRTILPTEIYLTSPDIGADGTLYMAHNLSTISRYQPNGAKLWDFAADSQSYLGSAIVNPQNTIITAGGSVVAEPGFIIGLGNSGQLLWTINLPEENGGFVRALSRARFTADGATVYYGMDVNDYAADTYTYLYAITASADGSTPTATPTSTPTATPTTDPEIAGNITYGNAIGAPNQRFVSNVLVSGSGSTNVSTTTDFPNGSYSLAGFGAGSYTVSPSKTGGMNNAISSFDAARIAQHVAGVSVLSGNQFLAADVSSNGSVSSFDAGQVARYAAGVSGFGSTANWVFNPVSKTYASVTTHLTAENYTAFLMGEVSGNWTNTGAKPVDHKQSAVGLGTAVELPDLTIAGKEVIVPVRVQGVSNKAVISYEFDLRYDPSVVRPLEEPADLINSVSRGLSVLANATEPGLLRVVVYGPLPIDENGVLLNLRFTAVGKPGSVSPLAFERFMFNEGDPGAVATDGRVELSGGAKPIRDQRTTVDRHRPGRS